MLKEKILDQSGYLDWFNTEKKLLISKQTSYQRLEIYETEAFGKALILDGDLQSTAYDEDIYHEVLVHPALISHPNAKSVLILGGGEGATLREVLKHPSIKKVVMLEIDPDVIEICKKEMASFSNGAFEDPRLELKVDDAYDFIEKTDIKFDCVISDLTDPYTENPVNEGLSFTNFSRIKNVLEKDGIFAMQASYAARGVNQLYVNQIEMLKKPWKIVRPYRVFVPSFRVEWGFILASDVYDALALGAEKIDGLLKPIASKLRYYDGTVHQGISRSPKNSEVVSPPHPAERVFSRSHFKAI